MHRQHTEESFQFKWQVVKTKAFSDPQIFPLWKEFLQTCPQDLDEKNYPKISKWVEDNREQILNLEKEIWTARNLKIFLIEYLINREANNEIKINTHAKNLVNLSTVIHHDHQIHPNLYKSLLKILDLPDSEIEITEFHEQTLDLIRFQTTQDFINLEINLEYVVDHRGVNNLSKKKDIATIEKCIQPLSVEETNHKSDTAKKILFGLCIGLAAAILFTLIAVAIIYCGPAVALAGFALATAIGVKLGTAGIIGVLLGISATCLTAGLIGGLIHAFRKPAAKKNIIPACTTTTIGPVAKPQTEKQSTTLQLADAPTLHNHYISSASIPSVSPH